MANQTQIAMFVGEDRSLVFTIKNIAETTVVDIVGWSISFMVKRTVDDPDSAAVLHLTTASQIAISGTWNESPAANTEVATVSVFSADTTSIPAGDYRYELKRTNAGSETVLAYGPFVLLRGVHWT